jgi:hypothetical protein
VGWWVVAGAAAIVTMHCHVIGVILIPIIAGLLVADVRRRTSASRRRAVEAGIAWLAIGLLSYVPLAIHELTGGGSEVRAAVAFLTGAGPSNVGLPVRLPIVGLRVLAWPLTGLITAAPFLALLAAAAVIGLTAWRAMATASDEPSTNRDERIAVRWLGLGLVWTIVALAIGASGLATVVPGLPNDHYHAFADPIVFLLVGLGLAGIARAGFDRPQVRMARAAVVAVLVGAVTIWNVAHQPPAVSPDGGWVAGAAAGDRVLRSLPPGPTEIVSLPVAKGPDAVRFPLVRDGLALPRLVGSTAPPTADAVARIVLCDDLFREAIGAACGGPAEDPPAASVGLTLVDRFEAAPGRWISVYLPS